MDIDDIVDDLLEGGGDEGAVAGICAAAAGAAAVCVIGDDAEDARGWGGRAPGSGTVKRGDCMWLPQYLVPVPVYSSRHLRKRFRDPLTHYRVLEAELPAVELTLLQRTDCKGRQGHQAFVKILNGLRRLGSGASFEDLDDQAHKSVESQRQAFMAFLRAVRTRFGPRFPNQEPTVAELQTISDRYAARVFPGCIGCVDCMELIWKNCPRALKAQYHNPKDSKLTVLSCEAVVDSGLYCRHWISGRPGTNNDPTVLDNSVFFLDVLAGRSQMHLPGGYELNGKQRDWLLYLLGDGAYPRCAILFLLNHAAATEKEKHAAMWQTSVRQDVERFFGCLQGRFKILHGESHEWSDETLLLTAQTCMILHNRIVFMRKSRRWAVRRPTTTTILRLTSWRSLTSLMVMVRAPRAPRVPQGPQMNSRDPRHPLLCTLCFVAMTLS